MAIILNEYKWAENAIQEKSLGQKPIETLTRIAKYYIQNGATKNDTRKMLDLFLLSCDASVSLVKWAERLDSIVKYAAKYPLISIDHVSVSSLELAKIKELQSVQVQRLAFTLLCIAKFNHMINDKNEYWVNTSDNEVMKMANIGTSIKRQSLMYSKLRDAGMIRFSNRVDSLSVQVLFVCGDDEEIKISDFRNLGYQYLMHDDDRGIYKVCENCGITFKARQPHTPGRPKKYCDSCAIKVKMKQNVDSIMRLKYK